MQITLEGKILSVKLIQSDKSWLGQIIHMDESLRSFSDKEIARYGKCIFRSYAYPSMCTTDDGYYCIYLWGDNRAKDSIQFPIPAPIGEFVDAILAFNKDYYSQHVQKVVVGEINQFLADNSYSYRIDAKTLILQKTGD